MRAKNGLWLGWFHKGPGPCLECGAPEGGYHLEGNYNDVGTWVVMDNEEADDQGRLPNPCPLLNEDEDEAEWERRRVTKPPAT